MRSALWRAGAASAPWRKQRLPRAPRATSFPFPAPPRFRALVNADPPGSCVRLVSARARTHCDVRVLTFEALHDTLLHFPRMRQRVVSSLDKSIRARRRDIARKCVRWLQRFPTAQEEFAVRSRKRRGTVDDSVLRAAIARSQQEQEAAQSSRLPPMVRLPDSEEWDMSPMPSHGGSPALRPARTKRRPSLRGRRDSDILDPDVSNWVDDDVYIDDGSPAVAPMRGQSPSPVRSRRSSLACARDGPPGAAAREPVASSGSASAHSFRTDSFQLPREASGQQGTASTPTSQGSRVPFFFSARRQQGPSHLRAVASASAMGHSQLHSSAGHSMRRSSAPGTGPFAMGVALPGGAAAPPAIPEDASVGSQGGVSPSKQTSHDAHESHSPKTGGPSSPDRTSQAGEGADGPKEESWSDEEVAESSESESPIERESSHEREPPSAHASSMAAVTGRAAWDSVPTLSTLGLEMPDQPLSPQDADRPRRRQRSGSVHEDAPTAPRRRRGGSFSGRDKPAPPPRYTRPMITPNQLIRARSMLAIAPSDRPTQPSQPKRWAGVAGRASTGHSVASRHSLALPHTRHLLAEGAPAPADGAARAPGPVLTALSSLPRSVSFSLRTLHPVEEVSTPQAASSLGSAGRQRSEAQRSPTSGARAAEAGPPDVFAVAKTASLRPPRAPAAPPSDDGPARLDEGGPDSASGAREAAAEDQ